VGGFSRKMVFFALGNGDGRDFFIFFLNPKIQYK
jgi:hypothetical protein